MGNLANLERRIRHKTGKAIEEFGLIEDGDRILVAISGGKDSWTMLEILEKLRRSAPVEFSLVAACLDPGYPGFGAEQIGEYLSARGFEHVVKKTNMLDVIRKVRDPEKSPCALCSRLRRGVLYNLAPALKCNKIALGHHGDDLIETVLMSMFFNAEIRSMPARLLSDDGRNIVIRPLVYVMEEETAEYARGIGAPVLLCKCPGHDERGMQRVKVKKMLARLEREHKGIKANILKSLANVNPGHLLGRAGGRLKGGGEA